jgi:fumarate hydratase class II
MGTVLTSEIGYEKTAVLVNEAHATGRTIRDLARETSGIPEERLSSLLDPRSQVGC